MKILDTDASSVWCYNSLTCLSELESFVRVSVWFHTSWSTQPW